VNQAVSTVLLPVNSAVLFVHDKVAEFWEAQRLNSTLKEENAQLKSRLGQLDSAEYRIARLEAENDQLRAMVGYKQKNPEETLLPGRVVGVSLGDLREYFFLDKGTADGVRQDMLVTTSAGLAGIVEDAYTHYSRVQYLSSSSSRIGVKVQRFGSNAVGVLAGHGPASARLRMMYIARDADIREGDLIVTNGLGGKYPSGVYIGKVASVTPGSGRPAESSRSRSGSGPAGPGQSICRPPRGRGGPPGPGSPAAGAGGSGSGKRRSRRNNPRHRPRRQSNAAQVAGGME
jgi:rod shape-determining protein MreC